MPCILKQNCWNRFCLSEYNHFVDTISYTWILWFMMASGIGWMFKEGWELHWLCVAFHCAFCIMHLYFNYVRWNFAHTSMKLHSCVSVCDNSMDVISDAFIFWWMIPTDWLHSVKLRLVWMRKTSWRISNIRGVHHVCGATFLISGNVSGIQELIMHLGLAVLQKTFNKRLHQTFAWDGLVLRMWRVPECPSKVMSF